MGFMANTINAAIERFGLGSFLGFQMGGARDMYGTFGWKRRLRYRDFSLKYERQAVARRVVNAYPDALWADPPLLAGDPAFNEAWQNLLSYQQVFPTLRKLDKLCRMGRFAIMVVGFDDGLALDQPVAMTQGIQRKILYMQPYSEGSVLIKEYEQNTSSARYGLPLLYQVSPGLFTAEGQIIQSSIEVPLRTFNVHWTRVLHIAENALESPVFGTSCLLPIYNDLDDLEKITGGSAEIFWLNSRSGLHIDVDKDVELNANDAAALEDEIDEYSNNLRRVIRTRGVKVTNLGSDFLNPSNVYDVSMSNIATATGIPKRELMGSEAGQLASQQDRANWSNRCEERITEYGNPIVLLPFLRLCIDTGVLPPPTQLSITWPDAFKMNPLERAQTSAQMARSAANLAKTLFTVEQINHVNAMDATEQPIQMGFGGGFNANASTDPSKSSSGTSKTPSGTPSDPGKAAEPQMQPALRPDAKTDYQLLTVEECRQIIGFGKHMPVFDSRQDSTVVIGSTKSIPSFLNPNPG